MNNLKDYTDVLIALLQTTQEIASLRQPPRYLLEQKTDLVQQLRYLAAKHE
jgi:hypothetical protein